jgi:2-oxoglutarate dehydrogenase E2 component (dihydrolipoamide succinyltransferase)
LEISTDKVDTEVPSPVDGVLSEILAQANETVEVGKVIARISTDGDEVAHPHQNGSKRSKLKRQQLRKYCNTH